MATISSYDTAAGRRYRVRYRKPDRSQTDKRGFRTKRDAEEFAASVTVSKATGTFVDPSQSRETVGVLGATWLAGKKAAMKPSSFRSIDDAWRVYVEPKWGSAPVGQVTYSSVRDWVQALSDGTAPRITKGTSGAAKTPAGPKSATVVLRAHGVLAGILDVAERDRRIPANPARRLDNLPRKGRKAHTYLTHQQVHAVADASGEYRALILTAAYTGLRWGELAALRVKDLDPVRRRLAVVENAVQVGSDIHVGTPKMHEQRSVPFPAFLDDGLRAASAGKTPTQLLFGNGIAYMQRPKADAGSRSWLRTALDRAGIETMTVHDFRHTAASLAVSSGANVKAVQRMLGHASAAMTLDVYSDLFDDDLDAVATALNEAVAISSVGKSWADGSPSE